MTEAFEIGVSLALQDGVSDAISKAQRDMAALERTLHDGGLSVRALREVGARAASVPVADRPAAVSEKVVLRSAPDPVVAPAQSPAQPQAVHEASAPVAGERDRGAEAASSAMQPASVRGLADENLHLPATPSAPSAAGAEAPVAPALDVPAPSLPQVPVADYAGQAQLSAPTQPVQRVVVEAPAPAAASADFSGARPMILGGTGSAAPSRNVGERESGNAPVVRLLALADVPSGAPAAAWQPNDVTGARVQQGGAEPDWADALAPAQQRFAPGASQAASPEAGPVAPQAQARDTSRQGGDVILDGVKVGRWMSRLLDREAGRASAGPTGFDPRRGRLLPGVTVGG